MRILRWLLTGIFLLALLTGIVFAYIAISFNPNNYKDTIVELVKEQTGRDLEIRGDIEMSFYPWLGLNMQGASLSNAPGFQADQFASFEQASARLQLMPLLQKQIVADQIKLSGAEVWLERNNEGVTNWDDILQRLASDGGPDEGKQTGSGFSSSRIAGLNIDDSTVHWSDAVSGDQLTVSKLNLETGQLSLGEETSISTDFHFDLKQPVIQGQAKILARSSLNFKSPYILANPNIELNLQGIDLQAQNIQANIHSDQLSFNEGRLNFTKPNVVYHISNMPKLGKSAKGKFNGAELSLDAGDLQLQGLVLDGQIEGSALPGEQADISLNSGHFSYTDKVLTLKDARVNAQFAGEPWPQGQQALVLEFPSMVFNTSTSALLTPEFKANVFNLNLAGSASGKNLDTSPQLQGAVVVQEFVPKELAKSLEFKLPEMSDEAWQRANLRGNYRLTDNSIHIDKMTAMVDGVDWTGSAGIQDLDNKKLVFDLAAKSLDMNRLLPPDQAEALQDNTSAKSENQVNAIEIPTEPLRIWDINGQVQLGKFTFGNMISSNVQAKIDLEDGVLKVSPTQMRLFGGSEKGSWTLDASTAQPRLTGEESFESIDLAQLGAAMWQKQHMTGSISGRMKVDTYGQTIGEMRANLNGNLDARINDGILQGIDINHALANAVSLFRNKSFTDEANTEQTPFKTISATGKIQNGILRNEDFLAELPRMRVRGNGSFSFIDTGINYHIDADILESKTAKMDPEVEQNLDELVGATIPVKITGDLNEPKIRPDVGGYLRSKVTEELKDRVKDELKDRVSGRLGGVLGDLLGEDENPEPEVEELPPVSENAGNQSVDQKDGESEPSPATEEPEEEIEEEPLTPEEELKRKEEELKKKAKDKLKDLFGG